MFKPLSLYIGLRYTRAKRRNHFISFISLASIIGIALGVAVLITVMAVMKGFEHEIQKRIFTSTPHITVSSLSGGLTHWESLQKKLRSFSSVKGTAPIVNAQAMLNHQGSVQGVMLNGVLPSQNRSIANFNKHMKAGSMSGLKPGSFGIVLGIDLARSLQAWVGDRVMVLTPKVDVTPLGVHPRYKVFRVKGVFEMGGGFGYDTQLALVHMKDAQTLLQMDNRISQVNVQVNRLFDAPQVADHIQHTLNGSYWVRDWTDRFGALFQAISMEQTMMFTILLLLIAIAAFNLVSTLVMLVNDKSSEIAILRTLGASPRSILAIFMVQGLTIGLFGTLLGLLGGLLLADNVTSLASGLETLLGTKFISGQIYFINYLPSKIQLSSVIWIAVAALALSFLATIYPAWRAARTNPAEALRYE